MVQKELVLEGLCCGNCAARIERDVARLGGVTKAAVNLATQTLAMEIAGAEFVGDVVSQATAIAGRIEPDIVVRDKEASPERRAGTREDSAGERREHMERIAFGVGVAFFAVAIFARLPFWLELGLYIVSYLLIGGEVVLRAGKNIVKGQIFDENFLMSLATVGAFAVGEYPEAVAVMLFYQVGEFFQNIAVKRSRRSIAALMDIRPDYANLKVGEEIRKVSPETVAVGDVIVIRPGERVPLDGVVLSGASALDTSALTGESAPRDATPGDAVLSGAVNQSGVLTVEVTKGFGQSTVSKILELVQNAGSKKAPTENFITKFARYYTPAVVIAAALLAFLPPLFVPSASLAYWLNKALVFLVVSCPCALVISIPLGFFGGIGGASRNGILVKGSNYLEALAAVDTVVFDKTGTLTKGVFRVTEVAGSGLLPDGELLRLAAHVEGHSSHPIALSIRQAYGGELDLGQVSDYRELPGHGILARVGGRAVLAGNDRLLRSEGVAFEPVAVAGTVVYLSVDGSYAGHILISDEVKPDSAAAVRALKDAGVRRLVMLTGDSRPVGEAVARELGIGEVRAELLPHQKVEALEALDRPGSRGKTAFVGDGINDAPVLARADVGVAMGGVGSDAAIEAADVVLMNDEPSKLATAIRIARRTRAIVWQNIVFALAVKAVILALGAVGIATIWEAVFGDVGVAVIAILNATRALRGNYRQG